MFHRAGQPGPPAFRKAALSAALSPSRKWRCLLQQGRKRQGPRGFAKKNRAPRLVKRIQQKAQRKTHACLKWAIMSPPLCIRACQCTPFQHIRKREKLLLPARRCHILSSLLHNNPLTCLYTDNPIQGKPQCSPMFLHGTFQISGHRSCKWSPVAQFQDDWQKQME